MYISVYGSLFSEYELTVSVEYEPIFDERLRTAVALDAGVSVSGTFNDEYEEAFFSFQPHWSMHENKTIVLLADSTTY